MSAYVSFRSPVVHALVALVFLVCCGLGSPSVRAETLVTIAPPSEVEEVSARVQAQLRAAIDAGEAERRKWPRLTWQGMECYAPASVRSTLDQVKSNVRQAAGDPRLAGLQAYLDGKLDSIGRMPPTMLITQPSAFRGRTTRMLGVRTDQADTSWGELRNFVESFLASARLAVDLTLASDPPGAQIQLQAGSNAANRMTLATTCQLKNIWRGLYRVKVEKPGYKSSTLDLDLVNQGALEVSCKLAKAGEADDSRCTQVPMK